MVCILENGCRDGNGSNGRKRFVVVGCSGRLGNVLRPETRDFFADRKLVDYDSSNNSRSTLKKMVCGSPVGKFTLLLEPSDRSTSFKHGADMLPGMVEGFTHYLSERRSSLSTLNKIRFTEKTVGDLQITIGDEHLQKSDNCTVYGNFTDSEGRIHHFTGTDITSGDRIPTKLSNHLSTRMLYRDSHNIDKVTEDICGDGKLTDFPLYEVEYTPELKKSLENNKGYTLTVALDILNLVFQKKLNGTGLVIGYEDIEWDKNMDIEALLDGACTMKIEEIGERKFMGNGQGLKCKFQINNGSKSIISGGAALYMTRR